MPAKKSLFALSILTDVQNLCTRMYRFSLRNPVYDLGGNVLKFKCHDINRCDKLVEQAFFGVRAVKFAIRDLAGRAVRSGFKSMNAIPHPSGSDAKHST